MSPRNVKPRPQSPQSRWRILHRIRHSGATDRNERWIVTICRENLHGFEMPWLLDHDAARWVLELSFVSPPFVLDFAAASLGQAPSEMSAPEWLAEKKRMFGRDWPDVHRLLDGLRLFGIHFPDVHLGNIRVRK
jgi:hypothetical protein